MRRTSRISRLWMCLQSTGSISGIWRVISCIGSRRSLLCRWIRNREEVTDERFLLVKDSCVYVLESGGIVTRCHHIKTLKEVMTSRDNDLGLRFPDGPDRYDLMLIFNTSTERDRFIVVLEKIYQFFTDRPLNLKQVEILRDGLQLRKPDGWLLKIEPLIPKKLFLQQMEAQKQDYTEEQNVINEEFERVRHKLQQDLDRQIQRRNEEFAQFKREYQALQDAHNNLVLQYDSMAQDVETYVRMLDEKDEEIQQYRGGNHPSLVRMQHEVEKMKLRQEIDDERQKGDSSKQIADRDREIAFLKETLRQKDDDADRLHSDLRRREEELASADAAIAERDRLLAAKQAEVNDRDTRLSEKERELRYTKSLMREAFRRQVEELDTIRSQFQDYDTQMVSFIQRLPVSSDAPYPQSPARGSRARSRSPPPPAGSGRTSPLAPSKGAASVPYSIFN
eukprot:TRINITY_DN3162_c0_g1_i2.p1 TRINITY_DN3162_c0_g1~~TRINITY_DN3162_c0_g1_i2.p1  ORF type:complete len:450 (+),score=137.86 TRINITY_DN3162_c0_g1_i2:407-1756(+)